MSLSTVLLQVAITAKDAGIPKVAANSTQIRNIFLGVLMLGGAVSVVFIIIGAMNYILSQGDAAKIKKAKDSITYAVVGLIVTSVAFLIVRFVVSAFA